MRFETAIEHLVDNYRYAKSKVWIRDEVAWALYHTWKEADDCKTEPTISKMEQVETMSCQECKRFHENAVMYLDQCDFCFKDCKYEPKDEPQTERSE